MFRLCFVCLTDVRIGCPLPEVAEPDRSDPLTQKEKTVVECASNWLCNQSSTDGACVLTSALHVLSDPRNMLRSN
ncbi:hypothetical protein AK812_SmicGene3096 [Symbiodinium microadriaticum]|uniref:Uncharacterized protein n=1 Tax=Symbiodinium microadriaticum TaxID=2951 RepID=A0A1Q9EZY2_SYMMI|nr:hypothetical protein AK812_SmicGene3096 [Symbiodinium microadriaticum]